MLGNKDIGYVVLDLGVNESPYVYKVFYSTKHIFVIKYTKYIRSNSNVYKEINDNLEDGLEDGLVNGLNIKENNTWEDKNAVEYNRNSIAE